MKVKRRVAVKIERMSGVSVFSRFAETVHVVSGGKDSEHIPSAAVRAGDSRRYTPSRYDKVCSYGLSVYTAVIVGSDGITE